MTTIDMFKTRSMTEAILQMKPAQTFMLSRLFNQTRTHNSHTIDVDIWKGKRKVAPYSRIGSKATPLERIPFATQPMSIPYIKLSRSLEAVLTLLRMPGENVYSGGSPADRAREQLALDLADINDAITRAEELQAVQAIVNGKSIIVGEEMNAEADFGRSSTHTYNAGTLWTAAGSDPGDDMRDANLLIQQDTGLTADVVILGKDALTAFLKHDLVLDQLDTQNGFFGTVNSNRLQFPGATYYGLFQGFEIWTYNEWYLDDADNTEKPFIPVDAMIVTSTMARNWKHYGPIMDMGSLVPERRFAKSWEVQDPSTRMLAVHSAPLMVPHDVDATVKVKVV